MRNKLIFILAICAFTLTGCDKESNNTTVNSVDVQKNAYPIGVNSTSTISSTSTSDTVSSSATPTTTSEVSLPSSSSLTNSQQPINLRDSASNPVPTESATNPSFVNVQQQIVPDQTAVPVTNAADANPMVSAESPADLKAPLAPIDSSAKHENPKMPADALVDSVSPGLSGNSGIQDTTLGQVPLVNGQVLNPTNPNDTVVNSQVQQNPDVSAAHSFITPQASDVQANQPSEPTSPNVSPIDHDRIKASELVQASDSSSPSNTLKTEQNAPTKDVPSVNQNATIGNDESITTPPAPNSTADGVDQD